MTRPTSWSEAASASSTGTAACGLPANTTLMPLLAAVAQRAQRLAALLGRGAVQDQDAVEVVHLVLDHAGLVALGLQRDLVPREVLRAHADRGGAGHLD